jgi:hypothetical protein
VLLLPPQWASPLPKPPFEVSLLAVVPPPPKPPVCWLVLPLLQPPVPQPPPLPACANAVSLMLNAVNSPVVVAVVNAIAKKATIGRLFFILIVIVILKQTYKHDENNVEQCSTVW